MSIENLKKILESERDEYIEQFDNWSHYDNLLKNEYLTGSKAMENRLLPLLQKAVENIEKLVHELEVSNMYDESCSVNNWIESEPEKQRYDSHKEAAKKAREFLLSLSETTESVEVVNE